MIIYLIKMTLCTLLMYSAYSVFLEKENIHRFKRFYLLFGLVFSLSVPALTPIISLPFFPEPGSPMINGTHEIVETVLSFSQEPNLTPAENKIRSSIPLSGLITISYLSVVGLFLFRFIRNLKKMNAVREQADRIDYPDTKIILTREKLSPYSFGKYVFLSKEDFENGRIANEILIHEKAHVTQKHWLDIFFIELLISVFWFNPVLRLYRNKMKENHEFLADEAVLRRTENIPHYQMLLINMISQKNTSLVSGFNYLTTKKRFIMMTKTFEKKAHWKKIAVVPLFILAIGIFSTKIIAENGIRPSSDSFMENHQADETLIPGQGVSPELIKEFREIVNKYIENADDNKVKWKTYNLSEEERNRLYCIYIQMNDEQRKDQYMRFRGPLTPMQLRSPNRDEWQSCKKASILWIDGKKAEPAVLNSHKRTDFTFFINNYIDTERKEYQSALWTKQGYEDYTRQYKNQISSSKLLEIKPQVWFIRDIESKKDNQRIYYGADIQNKQDN